MRMPAGHYSILGSSKQPFWFSEHREQVGGSDGHVSAAVRAAEDDTFQPEEQEIIGDGLHCRNRMIRRKFRLFSGCEGEDLIVRSTCIEDGHFPKGN